MFISSILKGDIPFVDNLKSIWKKGVVQIVNTLHFEPEGCTFELPREQKKVGAPREG